MSSDGVGRRRALLARSLRHGTAVAANEAALRYVSPHWAVRHELRGALRQSDSFTFVQTRASLLRDGLLGSDPAERCRTYPERKAD